MDHPTALKAPLSKGISHDRFGIEKQKDGSIHVHYHDLRIHLSPADFYWMAVSFVKAMEKHAAENKRVMITNKDGVLSAEGYKRVTYHDIVKEHVEFLNMHSMGTAGQEVSFRNKIIDAWSAVGDKKTRCLGFPPEFPKNPSIALDYGYLASLRDAFRLHGYDHQHFPIIAYDLGNGDLYIKDAHRLACLIALGSPEFVVVVMDPETGWQS